jgi:hypothetical protein
MNDINVEAVVVEVSKLSLKEGDILLLKIDATPQGVIDRIKKGLGSIMPKGTHLSIMPKSVELTIIEKDDAN